MELKEVALSSFPWDDKLVYSGVAKEKSMDLGKGWIGVFIAFKDSEFSRKLSVSAKARWGARWLVGWLDG